MLFRSKAYLDAIPLAEAHTPTQQRLLEAKEKCLYAKEVGLIDQPLIDRYITAFVEIACKQHEMRESMPDGMPMPVSFTVTITDPPARSAVSVTTAASIPATAFTATFMGESTILAGEAGADGGIATALGRFRPKMPVKPGPARIAIRPENVRLATGAEATAADVRDVVFQGSFIRVVATLEAAPEISVLARLPAGTEIAEGDRVGLAVDPSRIIVLGD